MPILEVSREPNSNQLTSSAAGSHVWTSAKWGNDEGLQTTTVRRLAAAFGLSSPALLGSFDHDSLSLRTSQGSLLCREQWGESLETLPDSGMWDAGGVYALQTSGAPICESGCLLSQNWPTARSEDSESCGNHPGATDSLTGATATWRTPDAPGSGDPRNRQDSMDAGHQVTIAEQAEHWQTPATDNFRSRGGDRKDEPGLDQQARMFPTPSARDWKSGQASDATMNRNARPLNEIAEHLAFPSSLPDPQIPDGPQSSETSLGSRHRFPTPTASMATMQDMEQAATAGNSPRRPKYSDLEKRRLNPRFVSWLMGLDPTWTEI